MKYVLILVLGSLVSCSLLVAQPVELPVEKIKLGSDVYLELDKNEMTTLLGVLSPEKRGIALEALDRAVRREGLVTFISRVEHVRAVWPKLTVRQQKTFLQKALPILEKVIAAGTPEPPAPPTPLTTSTSAPIRPGFNRVPSRPKDFLTGPHRRP